MILVAQWKTIIMKKKVLFCSEATFLNTGYAIYTKEVLKYLHSTGKYEIAELASYGEKNDPRGLSLPWRYYGVMPNVSFEPRTTKEEHDAYNANPSNQFGAWAFESVCLDFMPDIVCDVRDFWMMSHEETSPFRPYYYLVWMPTVDAYPQARQWVASYSQCDACFTYSNWAGQVLKDQSGGKVNWLSAAPPCANKDFQPIWDKDAHKQNHGIDPNYKIIGTVMRNQRRKLYPDLFAAFRKFLDQSEDKRFYLYCHTSYPDLGWDIPELIQEHNLSSHVLFTYICHETNKFFPSLFRGPIIQSPFTGRWGATLSNVKKGLNDEDLSKVYNLFDLYVQYANCEGFGIPMVEAASCGIPIMGTDYSAMESVIRELGGFTIKPKALYKELETGCMRAVPDNDLAASMFKDFFTLSKEQRLRLGQKTKELCVQEFNIQKTGQKWEKCFDELPKRTFEQSWGSQPRIRRPAQKPDVSKEGDFHNLAKWLIANVLCEPERLNSYMESRLARDLMYRSSTSNVGGMYFNESSAVFDGLNFRQDFNFDMAYDQMLQLCERRNQWEQARMNKIQGNK